MADRMVASSLTVGSLDVDIGTSMEATVEAVDLGALTMRGQTVRDLHLGGAVVANVGGGSVEGTLGTADGGVKVSGPIELSPLRGRADVAMTIGFEGARSGLAVWLREGLPDEERARAPETLTGQATGRLGLSASGDSSWVWTSFAWREGVP